MKDSKSDILNFWFVETAPASWFQRNVMFDEAIRTRFGVDFDLAVAGIYDGWAETADGALALCIVLDQFPRNMYRDDKRAFATDGRALALAKASIARGFDKLLQPARRYFLYMPFQHAEDLASQEEGVRLFASMRKDNPMGHEYAIRHRDIIAEFGRFPHRNEALGRASTEAERAYLAAYGNPFAG